MPEPIIGQNSYAYYGISAHIIGILLKPPSSVIPTTEDFKLLRLNFNIA
jgi:hypothetical protein